MTGVRLATEIQMDTPMCSVGKVRGASSAWAYAEAQEVQVERPLDDDREWCNWVADGIAGSARKMAEKEEKEWVAQVDKWNAEVDRRERLGGITK
jgi:hypothetical protein